METIASPDTRESGIDLVTRFKNFLWNYIDQETKRFKYRERLAQMAIMGQRSLIIDFEDITLFDRQLAHIIEEEPDTAIEAASIAIKELIEKENPDYAEAVEKFYPRFRNLSRVLRIRDLTSEYIGKMIAVEGILTRLTKVSAKLVKARYKHLDPNCMAEFDYPEVGEMGERLEKPTVCPICNKGGKFQLLLHKSRFVDWQKIVIQEKPEEIPPGQIPRSIEVVLTGDLVDTARPGDRVMITGILRVMPTSTAQKGVGRAVFTFYIDANYIDVQQKVLEEIEITREDEEKIRELARDPWIREKIIASIAPAIYGYWDIKEAIALQLFGGVPKPLPDGTRIRGDIHVLLVGDPGTAKSQMLQYTARIAPRGIYTSGKGATAAGLTASVLRDKTTGEYYLEAGALVIADGGIACVHPDTLLLIDNGELIPIKNLFREEKAVKARIKNTNEEVELHNIEIVIPSYNIEKKRLEYVKASIIRRKYWDKELIKIKTKNGNEILLTPDHLLVEAQNNKWIMAEELSIGDKILVLNNGKIIDDEITEITRVKYHGYVYDLYVPKTHSFIANNIVVHNCIDEIDKMRDEDRSAIHEALEQQSYHYDFEIMINNKYVKIGEFIDKLFEKYKNYIVRGKDTEILPIEYVEENITLLTYDPVNDAIREVKPDRFSRHRSPGRFVKITVSNGRSLTVTPEHPVLIVTSNGVEKVPAITVKPGDLVLGVSKYLNYYTGDIVEELKEKIIYDNGILGFKADNYNEAVEIQDKLLSKGIETFIVKNNTYYIVKPSGPHSYVKLLTMYGKYIDYDKLDDIDQIPEQLLSNASTRYELEYYSEKYGYDLIYTWEELKHIEEKLGRNTSIHMVVDVEYYNDDKHEWTYDVTIEPTHLFISHGLILHNTISIAKAGIVARLNARASVLAAGNPKFGRYDSSKTVSENIDLPPPILSRFDLIFIVLDIPDKVRDTKLARHILSVHSDVEKAKPVIEPQLLKKYISYARRYIKPRLTKNAQELLEKFYVLIRNAVAASKDKMGPIAITPRQLEALIRLSEAHAKMALKTRATEEDAEEAIRLMFTSLTMVGVDRETGMLDWSGVITGYPYSKRERIKTFMNILDELFSAQDIVDYKTIVEYAKEKGLEEEFVKEMIRKLKRDGVIYEPKPGQYGRIR